MKRAFVVGLSVLALAGCGGGEAGNSVAANAPLEQVPAPNGGDWSQVTAATPEGVRIGNPDAPVKLVEYASFACPHCGEFSEAASEELKNSYVKSGQVSWEFRPFLLFPTDPAVSLLMQCMGPEPYFRMAEQIYASQQQWYGQLTSVPQEQLQALETMPPVQRNKALVQAAGLDAMFRQRGLPAARIDACLSDTAALDKLVAVTSRATSEEGVTGTPTFLINGEIVPTTADWATLEPKLRAAIGG